MKLNRRLCLSFAAAMLVQPSRGFAQAWPSRPLRLIVPYAPGGPTDILARLMAPVLSERLAQPVVVENVPGAGGNIGMAQGARATPDGHTLTVVAPNIVTNPLLYAHTGFDPYVDFVPVTVAEQSSPECSAWFADRCYPRTTSAQPNTPRTQRPTKRRQSAHR